MPITHDSFFRKEDKKLFRVPLRFRLCCVSTTTRPSGCHIRPYLALGAIWDSWPTVNVCRDSIINEQVERVKMSVCRITFNGSSANVTLSSQVLERSCFSCQLAQNFVKCVLLNLAPFHCLQNCYALFISHAGSFIIPLPNFHCVLPICERK